MNIHYRYEDSVMLHKSKTIDYKRINRRIKKIETRLNKKQNGTSPGHSKLPYLNFSESFIQKSSDHNEVIELASLFNLAKKCIRNEKASINNQINSIKTHYIKNEDDELTTRNGTKMNDQDFTQDVKQLNKSFSTYYQNKKNIEKIALIYQDKFTDIEKEEYWKLQLGEKFDKSILAGFEEIYSLLGGNKISHALLADLFHAYHLENGRKLINELVTLLKSKQLCIDVIHGNAIQVQFEPTDKISMGKLSAKSNLEQDAVTDMNENEFKATLQKSMTLGDPDIIRKLALQYAEDGGISFGDTINKKGQHEYYLMETYITLLHELGHISALLKGEYFANNETVIPLGLSEYHELEEYMNISARELAENNMDPSEKKRFAHTGIEFSSASSLSEETIKKTFINEPIVKKKEKACTDYHEYQIKSNHKSPFSSAGSHLQDSHVGIFSHSEQINSSTSGSEKDLSASESIRVSTQRNKK